MESFRYKNLEIYKDAKRFLKKCNGLTREKEFARYNGFTSQIQRATLSIGLNIAEGSATDSPIEFSRFLGIAVRSIYETMAAFDICKDLDIIQEKDFNELENDAEVLIRKISSLKKRWKSKEKDNLTKRII